MSDSTDTRDLVRKHYASAARRVGRGAIPLPAADPITRDLYQGEQTAQLPRQALEASLGCGNPTMLAELRPGQVVLDLGSGGGIDVLLSARRVGPEGHVYGLDMTDDMLALARRNQAEAGVENVTFLAGEIEAIPLPDRSVDVVISNCVINLSADKDRVLREAFRVLRPGGLFAVSDMVLTKPLPDALRRSAELWAGCVSGALLESEYRDKLAAAGFQSIEIVPTRVFGAGDVDALRSGGCCSVQLTDGEGRELDLAALDGALISAFVRARKLP